jgi:photosystem II stability/assembly factor-like uncharacterized protein
MNRIILCLLATIAGASWSVLTRGVDTNLRGVSIVAGKSAGHGVTIWVSGSNGVILRSMDAGKHWDRLKVGGGESLDFRGVQAFDESVAYVMSSGEGEKSRIYKTSDGGKNWKLQYTDKRKDFFLDGLACSSSTSCLALSDPVDGKFVILQTEDGERWTEIPRERMPAALAKEGSFAASNSSLLPYGKKEIYFATGGPAARVYHSVDAGRSWTVAETPVLSGKAPQGIFSLARSGDTVVAVGGDYTEPEKGEWVAAYSLDQGKTWKLAEKMPGGYRSAVAKYGKGFVAVGPNGGDISEDGIRWMPAGTLDLNAVGVSGESGWGAGNKGTVARFVDGTDQGLKRGLPDQ